jgi:hypothetical protein
VERKSLAALFDFENRNGLFPDVDSRLKFCVLSLSGSSITEHSALFGFFLHDPTELRNPEKTFHLTPEEIKLLNPNTGTCPVFRSRRDAEITLAIYRRIPALLDATKGAAGNPWGVSFMQGLFNMTSDSHLFRPTVQDGETLDDLLKEGWEFRGNVLVRGKERLLPLYESKMLHHYDHRWATYVEGGTVRDLTLKEKKAADTVSLPRYWVPENDIPTGKLDKNGQEIKEPGVHSRLASKGWHRDWVLGFRKICRATDERTIITFAFPAGGLGDSGNILIPSKSDQPALLYTQCIALILDYVLRQKLGGTNLNFFQFEQLPILPPHQLTQHAHTIIPRALELTYTGHEMAPFARDLGDTGAPFRWDNQRRAVIRAELDALFFHLYDIDREDVSYILGTFPILERKEKEEYGEYRTKNLILAEYDRMAAAGLTLENPLTEGECGTYRSTLTPPPGQGSRHD